MQNEMLTDDSTINDQEKNYDSWEMNGDDTVTGDKETKAANERIIKSTPDKEHQPGKNSAAKAESQARSAVGNTNPNVRTGLSDNLNDTGTNVAYTERED